MLRFFSNKEYQQIADKFSLGRVQRITYFKHGYQTPKVAVSTAKGRYIIARHTLSAKKQIVADMKIVPRIALLHEIEFLSFLKNLPIPRYVPRSTGEYLFDFKNSTVSVYQFLPGSKPKLITKKMLRQLGTCIGSFHGQGVKYKKPMRERRKFYDLNPKVMTRMERVALRQTNPRLKAVIEEVKRGVEVNRPPRGLPRGPIHVDIKPDNELFVEEKLTGIVDFGNMYIGPLIFDVGKTIMWNCLKEERLDRGLMDAFLQGYESQRRLSDAEQTYLPRAILFAIYSHLWVDLYHVPIHYVPERYTIFLVKKFLPIARQIPSIKHVQSHKYN